MKKIGKVLANILIIVILTITVGCSLTKKTLDNTRFISIMSDNNFKVTNVTDQYNNYEFIKSVQVAISENNDFQIEFYELDTIENAQKMFESNKSDFEEEKSSSAFTSNINMTNYNTFTLSDDTIYRYICRVDNTLVYINTIKEHQKEVKEIIESLGY